jgi:large subunit ribosomal protein L23Ae
MAIIKHPLATEKGIRAIESENKLVFVVDSKAKKAEIKEEVERLLNAKVIAINTYNGPDGEKRAYVRFSNATPAIDIATKLGLM